MSAIVAPSILFVMTGSSSLDLVEIGLLEVLEDLADRRFGQVGADLTFERDLETDVGRAGHALELDVGDGRPVDAPGRAGGSCPPLLYFRRLPASALCILTEFAIMFLKLEEAGK